MSNGGCLAQIQHLSTSGHSANDSDISWLMEAGFLVSALFLVVYQFLGGFLPWQGCSVQIVVYLLSSQVQMRLFNALYCTYCICVLLPADPQGQ